MTAPAKLFCVLLLLFAATTLTSVATAKAIDNSPDAAHTLSDAQQQAIKRIRGNSEKRAALPALRLARVISQIYKNMLADKPDEKLRVKLAAEMKEVTWRLLEIKGDAIRQTVNVLTPQQKQLIKAEMGKPGAPADLSELITHTFNLPEK